MSILPKLICRFNIIPAAVFVEVDKLILKFTQKCKGHRIPKAFFKKIIKNKKSHTPRPDFKTYSKCTTIKTVLDWYRTDKITKAIQWKKNTFDPDFTLHTKITDLNVITKTLRTFKKQK